MVVVHAEHLELAKLRVGLVEESIRPSARTDAEDDDEEEDSREDSIEEEYAGDSRKESVSEDADAGDSISGSSNTTSGLAAAWGRGAAIGTRRPTRGRRPRG